MDTGLSRPGRLHDLSVTLSAASLGEIKSGGKGWIISAGFSESPFGRCLMAESPRGICHISFEERDNDNAALMEIQTQWPQAKLYQDDELARRLKATRKVVHPTMAILIRLDTATEIRTKEFKILAALRNHRAAPKGAAFFHSFDYQNVFHTEMPSAGF